MKNDMLQIPSVTINDDNTLLTLYIGYVSNGIINLNKAEACLLLMELKNFIEKEQFKLKTNKNMENLKEYLEQNVKEYQKLSDEYDFKLRKKREELEAIQNDVLSLESYFKEYNSEFNRFYKMLEEYNDLNKK